MNIKVLKKRNTIVLSLVLFAIIALNLAISFLIKKKLTDILLANKPSSYTTNIKNVDFKIIRRNLTLEGITLIPKKESVIELIDNKKTAENLENITLSSISFKGINILDLLLFKELNINAILINDLAISKFKNSNLKSTKKKEQGAPLNIDSITINIIKGIEIKNFELNNFKYQIIDISSGEVTFQNKPISFNSSGFKLENYKNALFRLKPIRDQFHIDNIQLNFENSKYDFSTKRVAFDFNQKTLTLSDLKIKPQISKFELADSYAYNRDIINLNLKELKIFNFKLSKMLKKEGIYVDSINLSALNISLFKDKRKPFDENKRPTLPHIALKKLKSPLLIKKVTINNSNLRLEEKLADKDTMMVLTINQINANLQNITSIESLQKNPLKILLNAKLMQSADLNLNVTMPLKTNSSTFYFNGTLGASKLKMFDSAIYPALGLKILSGQLDRITFNAKATNTESHGKMTMLYHDLEATVFKSNSLDKNKFLSWSVNHLIQKSNPNKKGKIKSVNLYHKRPQYKGFGNYIWKTLQSGITHTISPTGKNNN